MIIRQAFVTNSSSTCFIGWGIVLGSAYEEMIGRSDSDYHYRDHPKLILHKEYDWPALLIMHRDHFSYFDEYGQCPLDPKVATPLTDEQKADVQKFLDELNIKENIDELLEFYTYVSGH